MKSVKVFSGFFLVLLFSGCVNFFGKADLRTAQAKSTIQTEKAHKLLALMSEAHGVAKWDEVETYQVTFEDEFYGFLGKKSHPYGQANNKFQLNYIPNTYDGQMTFLNGKFKDQTWGIQSWKTYKVLNSETPVFKKDKDITFWLPTYQYFIEFPKRILSADAVNYAGTSTIEGELCEGVLVSWKTTAPQKNIDQYLIWINQKTNRIEKLEYTVRDQYKFLTGAAYFEDYKDYDGLVLPSRMPVETNLKKKGLLHEMRILDFEKNTNSVESLRPNRDLPVVGDDKM